MRLVLRQGNKRLRINVAPIVAPGGTIPAAPSNLTAAVVSTTEIDLTWTDNSTSETGFLIERSLDGSTWSNLVTVSPNVTSYANTGLQVATTYYYRVSATSGGGNSAASATTSAKTATTDIPINPTWMTNNAGTFGGDATNGPWVLDVANAAYSLAQDVTATGTAFLFGAANQILNLNGHTITFSNTSRAFAEDFEIGAIGTAPAGWDLSGAPSTALAANDGYLFGSQVLKASSMTVAETRTIFYDGITLPASGRQYAACVATSQSGGNAASLATPNVTITVNKSSGGTLLATGNAGGGNRSDGSIAVWKATDTGPVKITITITRPSSSFEADCLLDRVRVVPYADYGVVCSKDNDVNNVPGRNDWTTNIKNGYVLMTNPVLTDSVGTGAITMSGDGAFCTGVMCHDARSAMLISGVHINTGGLDGGGIDANAPNGASAIGTRTIVNNTITYGSDRDIFKRVSGVIAINCAATLTPAGNTVVARNTLVNVPFKGVGCAPHTASFTATVANNTIGMAVVQTNAYAISLQAYCSAIGNTITGNGRGILCDSLSAIVMKNVTVDSNIVTLTESPNREVGNTSDIKAFRARDDSNIPGNFANFDHLRVTNNKFTCYGGIGSMKTVSTCDCSFWDQTGFTNTDLVFSGNTYESYLTTTDLSYTVFCFGISHLNPALHPQLINETYKSNASCLAVGGVGPGSGGPSVTGSGVRMSGLKFSKSALGDQTRTLVPLTVGYATIAASDNQLLSSQIDPGSGLRSFGTGDITFGGTGTQDLTIGWALSVTATLAGSPVAGATVTVTGSDSVVQSTGTTDGTGLAVVTGLAVKRAYPATDTGYTPLLVSVTDGIHNGSTSVTPTQDTSLSLTIS